MTSRNDFKRSVIFLSRLTISFNPLTTNVPHHIENCQLICNTNQLTVFYTMGNISRKWLILSCSTSKKLKLSLLLTFFKPFDTTDVFLCYMKTSENLWFIYLSPSI